MAGGVHKKITREDIQLVQNLIERCLQLYMNQKEVVNVLLEQARIEPGFTELVWEKLREENKEFFTAYNIRLLLKDQIVRFNELLERQQQLYKPICPSEYAFLDSSIGAQIPSDNWYHTMAVQPNTAPHSVVQVQAPVEAETVSQNFSSNFHNAYIDVSSLQQFSSDMDLTDHTGRLEAPSSMPCSQNSNMGNIQGVGCEMHMSDQVYTGNSPVVFNPYVNALDAGSRIGVSPISSYDSTTNHHPLDPSTLDAENSTFVSLGQISRNFSLSDLKVDLDFSDSNEIFESYSKSIYVGSDDDLLFDLDGNGEHPDDDFPNLDGNGEPQGPSSGSS